MSTIEARLRELGLELPPVPVPVAEYVPAKRVGDLVYVSGQGPIRDGKPVYVGRVGAEVSLEEAYKAAQLCALNCLAAVKSVVGSLDVVEEIVQVRGFVNSAPDFYAQPKVVNGASELLVKIFGERGRHVRVAIGTSNLPDNIPIEIEMVLRIKRDVGL
jgi:enamine deaminase RidA (YjgF/YER057c/UK114 family)